MSLCSMERRSSSLHSSKPICPYSTARHYFVLASDLQQGFFALDQASQPRINNVIALLWHRSHETANYLHLFAPGSGTAVIATGLYGWWGSRQVCNFTPFLSVQMQIARLKLAFCEKKKTSLAQRSVCCRGSAGPESTCVEI